MKFLDNYMTTEASPIRKGPNIDRFVIGSNMMATLGFFSPCKPDRIFFSLLLPLSLNSMHSSMLPVKSIFANKSYIHISEV